MNRQARPFVRAGSGPRLFWRLSVQVLACAALATALAGCERGADSGATANPVAPGRPGTGNPVREVTPTPDPSPQSPGVGGPTHNIPEGATGSGGPTIYPGQAQSGNEAPARPGVGVQGGLGGDAPGGPATSPAAIAGAIAEGDKPQPTPAK